MLYIVIAILLFGLLIAVHEFGHFMTAKLLGVRVNEFSIGMGPALLQREKGETLYSLRALPIGGYCAMEGEDEESSDPRAFGRAAAWRKILILCAGAFMNFVVGLLLLLVIYSQAQGFLVPVYGGALEGYQTENCGLQEGDRFLSVDGHPILIYGNVSFYLGRAGDTIDLVVERDGARVRLDDVYLPIQERVDEEGNTTYLRGITLAAEVAPPTIANKLLFTWNTAVDYVRLVWMSLGDLISGAMGLRDLTGPVGIVDTISQVGSSAESASDAAYNILNFGALIAVNLAVMNLLPFPALDGGRVLFLLLNLLAQKVFHRKIDPRYEGYVHLAGFALLMSLMLVVTFSDIGKLFGY